MSNITDLHQIRVIMAFRQRAKEHAVPMEDVMAKVKAHLDTQNTPQKPKP